MSSSRLLLLVAPLLLSVMSSSLRATPVDIPHDSFTLPNGLRVIVHEDRKAPIVAVNLWYHVGSKDELPGRTGFAHLFEHLMFQGSENHRDEFFAPLEAIGATNLNGTTDFDRTNYFQNVPTTALDMILWLESDRMGHFINYIDQALLDEQRGVVQNEKRQSDNQPYGRIWEPLFRSIYPAGHPYSWTPIGSMADLDAASLEDVRQWFAQWYGPNNAVLVLAGDIDLATAKEKVTRYFGDIPASPPAGRRDRWIAERHESTRETLYDRVPHTRLYKAWNIPDLGQAQIQDLTLFARVLGSGRSSRLDRALIHDRALVNNVSAEAWPLELSGVFMIDATVKEGVDVAEVERILDAELARLIADGPTEAELAQAKMNLRADFIRGIEKIGGFGGKSDVLASCTVFAGDPGCFRKTQAQLASATADSLRQAGARWLTRGDHTLTVVPYGNLTTSGEGVDRSTGVPTVDSFPELLFPTLQRATLKNGLDVVLAERHDTPVVQFDMSFDGGYASDLGRRVGTASFTLSMLDEGAGKLDALELAAAQERIGAQIDTSASLDTGSVRLSALKEQLDASLALYADVIRQPRFEPADIDRVRAQWIADIEQEKSQPDSIGYRLIPPLLYGTGHPYAAPFTGTGYADDIAQLTRDELLDWHRRYLRPDNATLIVVGDTTLAELLPQLEKHFGNWKVEGSAPERVIPATASRPEATQVYLVNQPGAVQSTILVGQLTVSAMDPKALDINLANDVLGGTFTSRLNMNLREDKSWSYGVYSFISAARGQRPWGLAAPVQIDRTVDSIRELQRELREFSSQRPPNAEEVQRIKDGNVRAMPGQYETAAAVRNAIGGILRYERPDDYVQQLKRNTEALPLTAIQSAAATLDPNRLVWIVIGDLSVIEQPIRELKLGDVRIIDADGKPLR